MGQGLRDRADPAAGAAALWVERVLGPTGADLRRVGEGAVALAHRGVDVLNLSLGAFAPERNAEAAMTELVQHLLQIAKDRSQSSSLRLPEI